jgi:TetR/AcrR family transcriptional repressor of bet genes
VPQTEGAQKGLTRVARKEATRRELIEATIDAIADGGLADLTLARITERADVSRGLVNFHFDSKEQLLVATLAFLTDEYRAAWGRAIAKAGRSPAAQLMAIVRNDFHPTICNRKKVAVWFAFRGESKSRPTYLEVCTRADDEFERTVHGLLAELARDGGVEIDPRLVTSGLQSMIEGLWMDCLMYPQTFKRHEAMRTVLQYLAVALPRHFGPGA